MTRKRKANIRPELVGELFIDSADNIYRLHRCDTEPLAHMVRISGEEVSVEKPISQFANFVQLKPVRPVVKPRKPRVDSGRTHKKAGSASSPQAAREQTHDAPEIADKKGDNLTIHVPTGKKGELTELLTKDGRSVGYALGIM